MTTVELFLTGGPATTTGVGLTTTAGCGVMTVVEGGAPIDARCISLITSSLTPF